VITRTPLPVRYLGLPCKHCGNTATTLLIEYRQSRMALCDECAGVTGRACDQCSACKRGQKCPNAFA